MHLGTWNASLNILTTVGSYPREAAVPMHCVLVWELMANMEMSRLRRAYMNRECIKVLYAWTFCFSESLDWRSKVRSEIARVVMSEMDWRFGDP